VARLSDLSLFGRICSIPGTRILLTPPPGEKWVALPRAGLSRRPAELLRGFLSDLQTHRSIVAVMATGAGKTPIAIDIMRQMHGPALCLAHRGELLS
jgi:hypothetical protein